MYECEWMMLCEDVVFGRCSGMLTLINLIDSFQCDKYPDSWPRFTVCAKLVNVVADDQEGDSGPVSVRLVRDMADGTSEILKVLDDKNPVSKTRFAMFRFVSLRIFEPGPIRFRLEVSEKRDGEEFTDWYTVASRSIQIVKPVEAGEAESHDSTIEETIDRR